MRIRKLAKDLSTDPTAVMEMLTRLGHGRYSDVEQQLPAAVEAQVRRHARELPKMGGHALPAARPAPRRPAAEPDVAAFELAMSSVRPLGPDAPGGRGPSAPRRSPPGAPPPGRLPTAAVAPGASLSPAAAAEIEAAELRAVKAENMAAALRTRLDEAEAALAGTNARLADIEAQLSEAEGRYQEVDHQRRELQRAASAAAGGVTRSCSLRAAFERRGIVGEDEMSGAIRALLDAHRVAELGRIEVASAEAVEEFLWDRLLLLAEDETPPPGVVAVRVPAERSEGAKSSANRSAMSRFSTACLVNNVKRIVIVGGSPAYHRALKEGLDRRFEVTFIAGNRRGRLPQIPSADLVILWASTILDHSVSAQFPNGVVIPHRGIARMLDAATDRIEGR